MQDYHSAMLLPAAGPRPRCVANKLQLLQPDAWHFFIYHFLRSSALPQRVKIQNLALDRENMEIEQRARHTHSPSARVS